MRKVSKKVLVSSFAIGLFFIGIILLLFSIISVKENEYVVIKKFGQIRVCEEPGITFKIPIIETYDVFPKSQQVYDISSSDVLTADKKNMIADVYVLWSIADASEFLSNIGTIAEAERRISVVAYTAMKNKIGTMNQEEVITARGDALNNAIVNDAKNQLVRYGIQINTVKIKGLDLPAENKQSVFTRMISERKQIEAQFTAEGNEKAGLITNGMNQEAEEILSKANSKAQKIIAEGENEYMDIIKDAFSTEDKIEFYEFVKALDALKVTMKGEKTLFLPLDSELAKYFYAKE